MKALHFKSIISLLLVLLLASASVYSAEMEDDVLSIRVDTSKVKGPMTPIWA